MSKVVISVEGLGKRYQLGNIGTGTLSRDLNKWWARYRGKEDPYATLDPEQIDTHQNPDFWALQDLNFEVKQGEALGIIGKNGAGKSTLLKILSRVTSPTRGEIKVDGRIASLLEVGIGFHPELTGRENIFLNGAILGMTKREIKSKLDEIIDFSGVEQHIDTPVKRYSSGMYVRLAFAVAAHLEPEILIVDEVLAVGDADFQKKCLGKMNQVTGEGRTVLFVSHNMGAVQALCNRGIILKSGKVYSEGSTNSVISAYSDMVFNNVKAEICWAHENAPGNNEAKIKAVRILNKLNKICNIIPDNEELFIEIDFWNAKNGSSLTPNIQIISSSGVFVLSSGNWASTTANVDPYSTAKFKNGNYRSRVIIPAFLLNEGGFSVNALIHQDASRIVAYYEDAVFFTIVDTGEMKMEYTDQFSGVVRPKLKWNTVSVHDQLSNR